MGRTAEVAYQWWSQLRSLNRLKQCEALSDIQVNKVSGKGVKYCVCLEIIHGILGPDSALRLLDYIL